MHVRIRSRHALAAVAGSAVLAALLAALPIGAQPGPGAPASDVKVVNGASEPVPVAVQGTVAVGAAQQGAWSVGTQALDAPAFQPVHRLHIVSISPGQRFGTVTAYTVPAGKRLVLEYLSAEARLGSGTTAARVGILARAANSFGGAYLPLTNLGSFDGSGQILVGSEAVRMYADPGSSVLASVELDTDAGGARLEISFSGHLVDLP